MSSDRGEQQAQLVEPPFAELQGLARAEASIDDLGEVFGDLDEARGGSAVHVLIRRWAEELAQD